ncbi:unnamed protein product [Rotaria magnacalcarata]|uniref:Uncharacterized protein n=1 Tax=Rotaria magnacalcarata TaxID=392030 RepID=A0A8S2QGR2_9BILA|nr:unnamed protein product [Rotaria magnacalcarata]
MLNQDHDTVDQAVQTEIEPRTIEIPIARTSASHRTCFVCQKMDASPSVVLSEEQQKMIFVKRIQSARPCAAGADEGIIEVLVTTNNFLPVFNSIRSLDHFQLPMGYSQYLNNDYLSLILLIQKNNDETVILKFYLFQTRVR